MFLKTCIYIRFIPNCSTYFYILETLLCEHIRNLQLERIFQFEIKTKITKH